MKHVTEHLTPVRLNLKQCCVHRVKHQIIFTSLTYNTVFLLLGVMIKLSFKQSGNVTTWRQKCSCENETTALIKNVSDCLPPQ